MPWSRLRDIRCSHRCGCEDYWLLGCDTVWSGRCLLKWKKTLPSFSLFYPEDWGNMMAICKVTSSERLKKKQWEIISLRTKNINKLKLLINVFNAGIEALVSGKTISYACVKGVCRLWVQPLFDIFHQLLIPVEALYSEPVLLVGKEVVFARSEIRL
jgi:hypothetical protein